MENFKKYLASHMRLPPVLIFVLIMLFIPIKENPIYAITEHSEGINNPHVVLITTGITSATVSLIIHTPRVIGEGAESVVYTKLFSPYVYKQSHIEPQEMNIRNSIPYFAKNKYVGRTKNGLYIYRQRKVFMPKDPTKQFKQIVKDLTHKHHYTPFRHEFLQGIALRNDKYVISDFGVNGAGQIGRTWFTRKPIIVDMIIETIDEFNEAMEA